MLRRTRLQTFARLKRYTRISPRRIRPKRPHPGTDEPYLNYIRSESCCARHLGPCWHPGPTVSDPHHAGRKHWDREAIPLCRSHHRAVECLEGPFKGWVKAQRKEWVWERILFYQGKWNERQAAA